MKYHSVKSNARRAARKEIGSDAREGIDFELVAGPGGHAWRKLPQRKPRPAKRRRPVGPRKIPKVGRPVRRPSAVKAKPDDTSGPGAWLDRLCAMLARAQGATAAEVGAAFGWLEHTSRARISVGPRSRGQRAERTREERGGKMVSVYRLDTELPLGQTREELGVIYRKPEKAKAA